MRQDTAELLSKDRIIAALLDPSNCCSGFCPESAPLPSVTGVLAILHDVRELLFPGIHESRRTASSGGQTELHSLLDRIQSRLRIEVGRAQVHSRTATLRLHTGDAEKTTVSPLSASQITDQFLGSLPELRRRLNTDLAASFDGDPAARTHEEILLCYPGIEAVFVYRVAHELLLLGVPYLPRMMTEWAHRETGIDIHPGAHIGESFFIDHGTGVVIGETTIIGNAVTLYQGVTLGAWSFPRDEDGQLIRGTKRHPTLEDRVTVYSNATILGGTTVIGSGSSIGSSVSLNRSVPPNTIVTIERPSLRFREAC